MNVPFVKVNNQQEFERVVDKMQRETGLPNPHKYDIYYPIISANKEGTNLCGWMSDIDEKIISAEEYLTGIRTNFTLSDLKDGMIVKLRDDSLMMVVDNMLIEINSNLSLSDYSDTLEFYDTEVYDIVAIYEQAKERGFIFSDLSDKNYSYLKLIWKRVEVELTEDMKTLLRLLPRNEYHYLTRNDTSQGMVKLHVTCPDFIDNETWQTSCFVNGEWTSDYERSLELYSHIFETLPKGICIEISDYI